MVLPTVGTVAEDQGTGDWSFTHRVRCEGGPLDGQLFEVRSPDAAPWPVLLLGLRKVDAVKYMRLMPRKSMRPGDEWTYVPLPPAREPEGRPTAPPST